MNYAQSIPAGAPNGPGFGPPPWVVRGRGHRTRMRWAMMSEASSDTPPDTSPDGTSEGVPDPESTATNAGDKPRRERRHRGGHRHGRGPGPWGGRGPWGPPRGRRRERGDVRAAVLLLLAEQPRHGYELLTELADRSDGQWQPSPGSIYPVLKRLARDGLVTATHEDGKRIFSLTDSGRALVESEGATWGEPWAQSTEPENEAAMQLWDEGRQLGAAVWQVSQLNDQSQIEAASAILVEARKRIYGLLAE